MGIIMALAPHPADGWAGSSCQALPPEQAAPRGTPGTAQQGWHLPSKDKESSIPLLRC